MPDWVALTYFCPMKMPKTQTVFYSYQLNLACTIPKGIKYMTRRKQLRPQQNVYACRKTDQAQNESLHKAPPVKRLKKSQHTSVVPVYYPVSQWASSCVDNDALLTSLSLELPPKIVKERISIPYDALASNPHYPTVLLLSHPYSLSSSSSSHDDVHENDDARNELLIGLLHRSSSSIDEEQNCELWDQSKLDFTDPVWIAMEHLHRKQCLMIRVVNHTIDDNNVGDEPAVKRTLDMHLNLSAYGAIIGHPSTPSHLPLLAVHMKIFMAWYLYRAPSHRWRFPYPDEIVSMHHPVASASSKDDVDEGRRHQQSLRHVEPSDMYQHDIMAEPFSVQGDAFVPSPQLLPTLRRYQKAAVAWMLAREGVITVCSRAKTCHRLPRVRLRPVKTVTRTHGHHKKHPMIIYICILIYIYIYHILFSTFTFLSGCVRRQQVHLTQRQRGRTSKTKEKPKQP